MTSYSTLPEAMHVSCTVIVLQWVIYEKSLILTYSTYIWCPRWGWPRSNFAKTFGVRKSSWATVWQYLHVMIQYRHVTDSKRAQNNPFCVQWGSKVRKQANKTDDKTETPPPWRACSCNVIRWNSVASRQNTGPAYLSTYAFMLLLFFSLIIAHWTDVSRFSQSQLSTSQHEQEKCAVILTCKVTHPNTNTNLWPFDFKGLSRSVSLSSMVLTHSSADHSLPMPQLPVMPVWVIIHQLTQYQTNYRI